jgi:hypothetical protein
MKCGVGDTLQCQVLPDAEIRDVARAFDLESVTWIGSVDCGLQIVPGRAVHEATACRNRHGGPKKHQTQRHSEGGELAHDWTLLRVHLLEPS